MYTMARLSAKTCSPIRWKTMPRSHQPTSVATHGGSVVRNSHVLRGLAPRKRRDRHTAAWCVNPQVARSHREVGSRISRIGVAIHLPRWYAPTGRPTIASAMPTIAATSAS